MSLPCKIIYYITRKRVNKASNGDVIFSSRVTISSTHNGWVFVVSPDSLKFKHWNWIQITLTGGFLYKKPFFISFPIMHGLHIFSVYFLGYQARLKPASDTQSGSSICRITKLEVLQLLFYWRYIPQFAESRNLKSHKFWSTEGIYTWNFRQAALTITPLDGPSFVGYRFLMDVEVTKWNPKK